MSTYNPFISIAQNAIAELTSDNAKAFYVSRSLEEIDRVITVCTALYSVAHFVYALGAMVGEAHYSSPQVEPVQPCLPTPKAIALLPAAKVEAIAPAKRLIQSLTDTDDFRHETHLKLTKKQLIDRCAARGLQPKKSMRKAELAELLTKSYSKIKPHQYKSRNGRVVSIA